MPMKINESVCLITVRFSITLITVARSIDNSDYGISINQYLIRIVSSVLADVCGERGSENLGQVLSASDGYCMRIDLILVTCRI